jgi:hypothetical protein
VFAIGLGQSTLPTLVRSVIERSIGRWAGMTAGLTNSVLQVSGSLAVALTEGPFYAVRGGGPGTRQTTIAFAWAALAIGACVTAAAALAIARLCQVPSAVPS